MCPFTGSNSAINKFNVKTESQDEFEKNLKWQMEATNRNGDAPPRYFLRHKEVKTRKRDDIRNDMIVENAQNNFRGALRSVKDEITLISSEELPEDYFYPNNENVNVFEAIEVNEQNEVKLISSEQLSKESYEDETEICERFEMEDVEVYRNPIDSWKLKDLPVERIQDDRFCIRKIGKDLPTKNGGKFTHNRRKISDSIERFGMEYRHRRTHRMRTRFEFNRKKKKKKKPLNKCFV